MSPDVFRRNLPGITLDNVAASDGDVGGEGEYWEREIAPSPRPYVVVPGVEGDKVRTSGKYASFELAEPFTAAIGGERVDLKCLKSACDGEGSGVFSGDVIPRSKGG